eukprot:CAMPEP_0203866152 /NCGR_PEP_ID=MMETSP0359-20131031/15779_1 /ASSEMBLY_ACC=CAM_ASM_000338 /TAXON_ID=268821 /ORGANISM="Scrippsiella Hangoei, Strain SHTV-5" /LENGTH=191 /DNA_ID=CAMNT_0050784191 /DNA_START=30 /DNA_END=605 /DNA_ORIENTATION=-
MGAVMASAAVACCIEVPMDMHDIRACRLLTPTARSLCATSVERLIEQLFRLHDLNSDGALAESELVVLNQAVAFLHHGASVDFDEVATRFSELFRKLSPEGHPLTFATFREHVHQVLIGIDSNPMGQEMMIEQFVAEAESARVVCEESVSRFGKQVGKEMDRFAPEAVKTWLVRERSSSFQSEWNEECVSL